MQEEARLLVVVEGQTVKMSKRTGMLIALIMAIALSGCGEAATSTPAVIDTPAAKVVLAATSTATMSPTVTNTAIATALLRERGAANREPLER
jgi:hypothetical protein